MNYFDACDYPEHFLRAAFRSVSVLETKKIGQLFTPVASKLLNSRTGTGSRSIRIGFKALKSTGKTTLARAMVESASDGSIPEKRLHGWSNGYNTLRGHSLLHFDVEAIQFRRGMHPPDNMTMRFLKELAQHDRAYHAADMHFVEWPEKDKITTDLNVLWHVAKLSENRRQFNLVCEDEIAALPEFEQFLEDSAPYMV